jgi:HK97 family phage prohead protease
MTQATAAETRYKMAGAAFNVEDKKARIIEGFASTDALDLGNEIVELDAWGDEVLAEFMANPQFLFCHDPAMPLGGALAVERRKGGLWARLQFSQRATLADDIWGMVDEGFLKTLSIGYMPAEYAEPTDRTEPRRILRMEHLFDISIAPIPMNPEATFDVVRKGFERGDPRMFKAFDPADLVRMLKAGAADLRALKGAVAGHETAKADEGDEWDGAAAVASLQKWASSDGSGDKDKINWAKYRQGFTWFNGEDAENIGAYKLPHHKADGGLKVVWRGVAAAAAVVMGGRGGVDIPEGDMDGVKAHLGRHYAQFDKEPPWAGKSAVLPVTIELKEGRILSAKNEGLIREAHERLGRVLETLGEPKKAEDATIAATDGLVAAMKSDGAGDQPAAGGAAPDAGAAVPDGQDKGDEGQGEQPEASVVDLLADAPGMPTDPVLREATRAALRVSQGARDS